MSNRNYRKKGSGRLVAGAGLAVLLAAMIGLLYLAAFGVDSWGTGSLADVKLGLDLAGGVSITYQAVGDETPSDADMDDTVYKLQQRVQEYSTEAQVYREGTNRINIEIPGVSDANTILEELGQPGSLYFIRETDDDGNANYELTYSSDYTSYYYELTRTIDELIETGDVVLEGTDVADAQAGYQTDSLGNQEVVVSLTFTEEGKTKFAEATARAYENGESIAIYYDGEFISVPSVEAEITDGQAVITGEDDIEDAQDLAAMIRIGGLSVELEEVRSNVVGAQLGEDAIDTSVQAGIIGIIIVMIFMIAYYRLPGVAASLALLTYVGLESLIIVGFEVTLTLPGIAGILLSIGMAVDANVIVFARIREELREGRAVKRAIEDGYEKAQSAILDGNITTLIAALVLYFLGTGSVKGFAQTLAIGIVLSMFTALFVTRWYMKAFYTLFARDAKWYGRGWDIKPKQIVGKRKIFCGISGAVILIGLIAMLIYGVQGNYILNYSLDFIGGTSTDVTFDEEYTLDELNDTAVPLFEQVTGDSNVQVQTVTGSTEVIFKTATMDVEQREEISELLQETYGIDEDAITAETISSTVSSEMQRDTVVAVIVALILMLIYIWFRFKDMRFGAAAILALAHDVLCVLTVYAVLRISVGTTFVACMLTIVGYSINATIVIFDRIREHLAKKKKDEDIAALVDRSVSETMTRSLFTSLTTFIMVCMLYIFGVSSIREFALPIMAGIVVGCYSSICISGSLWLFLRKKFPPKHDDSGRYQAEKAAKDKETRKLQHEQKVREKTVI